MRRAKVLTKADVVVAICCVALLPLGLAMVGGGRRRAKEMVCMSYLRQWSEVFGRYVADNNGYFSPGPGFGSAIMRGAWLASLYGTYAPREWRPLKCPQATERPPSGESWGGPFHTFRFGPWPGAEASSPPDGSYGFNLWLHNPPEGVMAVQGRLTVHNWRTPAIEGGHRVPVLADSMWRGGGPYENGRRGDPPLFEGMWQGYDREMAHFCIGRHDGAVNILFVDWSVRKVGLKELWTLKWHRSFDTGGPWTQAGGALPDDWPEWMREFKDH